MNGYTTDKYRRITKPSAKRVHKDGKDVYIVPKLMNPENACGYTGVIRPEDDFDKALNAYEYYNCSYKVGKYCAFYIERD